MDWDRLSLAEKLGNIGSEVSRARVWQEKGDLQASRKSLERAIELLDKTISGNQRTGQRELARIREALASRYVASNELDIAFSDLENYFLPFALKARNGNSV